MLRAALSQEASAAPATLPSYYSTAPLGRSKDPVFTRLGDKPSGSRGGLPDPNPYGLPPPSSAQQGLRNHGPPVATRRS